MDAAAGRKACKPSLRKQPAVASIPPSSRASVSSTSEISMAQGFNLHLTSNCLEDSCAELFNYFAMK